LDSLGRIGTLRYLDLARTRATEAAIDRLGQSLLDCQISRNPAPLAGVRNTDPGG
jgi:hypothetical protein